MIQPTPIRSADCTMAAPRHHTRRRPLWPAMLLLVMSASCTPAGTTAARSGIKGTTMVDAGCPPAHGATPCPDRPLPARLTVARADSKQTVASARSNADGRFRIALPPGRYVIHATNLRGDVAPTAAPQTCLVHEHAFTTVTVHFDSGIR
jgi:hypothetical protein